MQYLAIFVSNNEDYKYYEVDSCELQDVLEVFDKMQEAGFTFSHMDHIFLIKSSTSPYLLPPIIHRSYTGDQIYLHRTKLPACKHQGCAGRKYCRSISPIDVARK